MALMKSISGIRGVVGESFTPDLVTRVAMAFAKHTGGGKVIVGRDSRITGQQIAQCFESVLSLCGCQVIDIGVVPTPTVQVMVEHTKAKGGVVISASHNPIQWNAFKLINKTGSFFGPDEMNAFLALVDSITPFGAKWDNITPVVCDNSAAKIHIEKVLNVIDVAAIRKKKFTVVLDSVNGAGSVITQELLKKLGCRVIPINCDMSTGIFPRGAEPVAKNLKQLSQAVKKYKADIGFAQDPDADRLAIVNEKGQPIGEELTVTLAALRCLEKKRGAVVVNMSTTKAIDDVASRFGVPVYRSKVGEIHVVEAMKQHKAVIGGEGNGGVISPEVHYGRDSLVGIAYCLELLTTRNESISQIVEKLPVYYMHKDTVPVSKGFDTVTIAQKIKEQYAYEIINTLDGIRIDFTKDNEFKGGWVHLRPSNTEPLFRIIAEGKTKTQCNAIVKAFSNLNSSTYI